MTDKRFAGGDVVIAYVGGRKMTVSRYDRYGRVVCQWFVGADLEEGVFSEAVLRKVDES